MTNLTNLRTNPTDQAQRSRISSSVTNYPPDQAQHRSQEPSPTPVGAVKPQVTGLVRHRRTNSGGNPQVNEIVRKFVKFVRPPTGVGRTCLGSGDRATGSDRATRPATPLTSPDQAGYPQVAGSGTAPTTAQHGPKRPPARTNRATARGHPASRPTHDQPGEVPPAPGRGRGHLTPSRSCETAGLGLDPRPLDLEAPLDTRTRRDQATRP